ncbi:HD domain-containing phosphohydrolase [Candidatus Latescibacterota bacterium]
MAIDDVKRLKDLIMLSAEISEVKDFDVLMERILQSARDFFNCDAGSIYIKDGNNLDFSFTQNDTLSGRLEPGQKLIYTTFTIPINNQSCAGYVASSGETLTIEDAYSLPETLPFCFDKHFDESANYRTHSILTVPLKTIQDNIVGVLQLINTMDEEGNVTVFDPEVEPYIAYFASSAASALERAQLMRTIILRMINMAELRDPKETGNHVNRVASYSVEIFEAWAKKRGVSTDEINKHRDTLRMAAMLHDVGKVAIADAILKKPGRLDDEEYNIMKQHTLFGARLFKETTSDFEIASQDVALNHHERFDGRGYPGYIDPFTEEPVEGHADSDGSPLKKKGDDIPLYGRVVALADVFDALSSNRAYKEAWSEEKVLSLIREERGKQFDPEFVDAFFVCLPAIRSIKQRYKE